MQPKDIIDNLEKATWSFDNPLSQPNAIGIYLLAKEAKKSLKVLPPAFFKILNSFSPPGIDSLESL